MAGKIEVYIDVFLSFYENTALLFWEHLWSLNNKITYFPAIWWRPMLILIFFEAILCQQTFWHHLFPKNSALDPIHSTVVDNNPPTQTGSYLVVLVIFSKTIYIPHFKVVFSSSIDIDYQRKLFSMLIWPLFVFLAGIYLISFNIKCTFINAMVTNT